LSSLEEEEEEGDLAPEMSENKRGLEGLPQEEEERGAGISKTPLQAQGEGKPWIEGVEVRFSAKRERFLEVL